MDERIGDGVVARAWRAAVVIGGLALAWEIAVSALDIPPYMLP